MKRTNLLRWPHKMALLITFLFCIPLANKASHVSGGFFSYECLGNDEYLVTLNLFRDCDGISMPSSVNVSFESTCGQFINETLNMVSSGSTSGGTEISQVCATQIPQTTCNSSSPTLPGNELYVYEAIVTIAPPCDTWTMSWNTCCRNTTINVSGSSSEGIYLEATLNSATAACNSSATFLTPYPVYYACANQPTVINYTIAEPDNNTLVYTLIEASESVGVLSYSLVILAHHPYRELP